MERAGFLRCRLETGADRQQRIREAILATVVSHGEGIAKTRLARAVRDGHDGMPGVNVIRGAIDELCASGELVGTRESRGFIIRHPDVAIPLFA